MPCYKCKSNVRPMKAIAWKRSVWNVVGSDGGRAKQSKREGIEKIREKHQRTITISNGSIHKHNSAEEIYLVVEYTKRHQYISINEVTTSTIVTING